MAQASKKKRTETGEVQAGPRPHFERSHGTRIIQLFNQLSAESPEDRLAAVAAVESSDLPPELVIWLLTISLRDESEQVRDASVGGVGNLLHWAITNEDSKVASVAWDAVVECAFDESPAVRQRFIDILESIPESLDLTPRRPFAKNLSAVALGTGKPALLYYSKFKDSRTARKLAHRLLAIGEARIALIPTDVVKEDDGMSEGTAGQSWSLKEVAQHLGISRDSIRAWIENQDVEVEPNSLTSDQFGPEDVRALSSRQLCNEITSLFSDPDTWLDAPNVDFGGFTPRELIGTDDEELVHNFVESMKHGIPS